MIEFGGKTGYPWHGLYRSDTGKIDTPGGVSIDPPGSYPSANVYGRQGDCFCVEIPGMAAVSTTAAEAAKGMTWLNYALMSGHDHVLYGRDLGGDSWIAIADGKPWRIQCFFSLGAGVLGIYAVISRFGIFSDAPAPQVLSFSHSVAFDNFGSGMSAVIDDIKPGGMSALVGISEILTNSRNFGGAVELQFSYLAGAWSCGSYTVVDYETTIQLQIHESISDPAYTSSDYELIYCHGVRYSATGSVQRIELQMRIWGESTYNGAAPGEPGSGTGNGGGWLRLLVGSAVIREVTYTSSLSWSETGSYTSGGSTWYRAAGENSMTIDGVSFSRDFIDDSLSDIAHRRPKGAPSLVTAAGRDNGFSLFRGDGVTPFSFRLQKYSAALYGLSMIFGGSTDTVFSQLVGRIGSSPEMTSSTAFTHATEHPVTGDIERSTSLVCWV